MTEKLYYFGLNERHIPKNLELNKPYEIILKNKLYFDFMIGSETELWSKSEGFRMKSLGKAIIDEISYIPGNNPLNNYTLIKFKMTSLKENGLGRKIQA